MATMNSDEPLAVEVVRAIQAGELHDGHVFGGADQVEAKSPEEPVAGRAARARALGKAYRAAVAPHVSWMSLRCPTGPQRDHARPRAGGQPYCPC